MSEATNVNVNGQESLSSLEAHPLFHAATEAERAALVSDFADQTQPGEGISPAEYLESLAGFASAAEYLADAGITPEQAQETAPQATQEAQEAQDKEESSPKLGKLLDAFERQVVSAASATMLIAWRAVGYLTARMALSEKVSRGVCIGVLRDRWQEHSDSTVTETRVSDVVRQYATLCIFSGFPLGTKPNMGKVSLRVLREMSRLIERDTNVREEVWTVKADHKEAATSLWAEVTSKGLKGPEVASAVDALLYPKKAEAAKAEEDDTDDTEEGAESGGNLDTAANCSGPGNPPTTDPVKGPATVGNLQTESVQVGQRPEELGKAATPQDLAEYLFSAMAANEEPDEVFSQLADKIRQSGDFGKRAKKAACAVLAIVNDDTRAERELYLYLRKQMGSESPVSPEDAGLNPVQVNRMLESAQMDAERNGQPAAA